MRFERWTVVLAVIAALPAIPSPHFLRAVSVGTSWGTPLYVAALAMAAALAFKASGKEERARKERNAAMDAKDARVDAKLAQILEAKSPAELNAKVADLRGEIDFRDGESDGVFR